MNILSFPKKLRLLKTNDFKQVFKNAYKVQNKEIIIFGNPNDLLYPRLGISITKKKIKYAYLRNKIKRLIKEYFRLSQNFLIKMDFLVVVKKNILINDKKLFIKKIHTLWKRYYQFHK
ncbi:ribonuclease P protein component [Buchnera aphidicola (Thelaxes californica)]|uniref:Ribonuclease P protein component n=1 Tax=Buchnera aphidicola (Thelaxes californica) TaxID=1315998 RepID=A0A4D6YBT6_9GAMM|nr:ribonuclease P protein component [Buchnera aphidicola]QCI26572.1 ribonuclease P protein component [Buchnera aphidicola (Thelaxes californica)]